VIAGYRVVIELGLASLALVGAAVSWLHSRHLVAVAPIADGQPVTMSVVYDPPQLLLTMLLAMLAGVLAVVGTARLRRARCSPNAPADGLN
jgi:NO-binding membrane sensor protein with MHYT domain